MRQNRPRAPRSDAVQIAIVRKTALGHEAGAAVIAIEGDPFAHLVDDDLERAPVLSDADLAALYAAPVWTPERCLDAVLNDSVGLAGRRLGRERAAARLKLRQAMAHLATHARALRHDPGRSLPTPPGRTLEAYHAARAAVQRAQAAVAAIDVAIDAHERLIEDERAKLMPTIRAALDGTSPRWRLCRGRIIDEKGRALVAMSAKPWQVL